MNGRKKWLGWAGSAAVVMVVALAAACAPAADEEATTPAAEEAGTAAVAADDGELVARGEYLVTVASCHDCHTPFEMGPNGPQPDMTRMLSGHPERMVMPPAPDLGGGPWIWTGAATNTAFAGPWGVSYASNLTPDEATGMGIWSEEMFVTALRTGRHMGQSRPIQPPMPWPNLARATDEDLRAIYLYLRSIPPIRNRVPDYQPPGGGEADPLVAPPTPVEPAG
jgi:mono/diheme cytochrome c family protein